VVPPDDLLLELEEELKMLATALATVVTALTTAFATVVTTLTTALATLVTTLETAFATLAKNPPLDPELFASAGAEFKRKTVSTDISNSDVAEERRDTEARTWFLSMILSSISNVSLAQLLITDSIYGRFNSVSTKRFSQKSANIRQLSY
jgi:hypothetical protein